MENTLSRNVQQTQHNTHEMETNKKRTQYTQNIVLCAQYTVVITSLIGKLLQIHSSENQIFFLIPLIMLFGYLVVGIIFFICIQFGNCVVKKWAVYLYGIIMTFLYIEMSINWLNKGFGSNNFNKYIIDITKVIISMSLNFFIYILTNVAPFY